MQHRVLFLLVELNFPAYDMSMFIVATQSAHGRGTSLADIDALKQTDRPSERTKTNLYSPTHK